MWNFKKFRGNFLKKKVKIFFLEKTLPKKKGGKKKKIIPPPPGFPPPSCFEKRDYLFFKHPQNIVGKTLTRFFTPWSGKRVLKFTLPIKKSLKIFKGRNFETPGPKKLENPGPGLWPLKTKGPSPEPEGPGPPFGGGFPKPPKLRQNRGGKLKIIKGLTNAPL